MRIATVTLTSEDDSQSLPCGIPGHSLDTPTHPGTERERERDRGEREIGGSEKRREGERAREREEGRLQTKR